MSPSMTIKVVGHQWYTSPEFYPCDLDDQNLYSMAPRPLFLSIAKPNQLKILPVLLVRIL
jgi:hypothetical protein